MSITRMSLLDFLHGTPASKSSSLVSPVKGVLAEGEGDTRLVDVEQEGDPGGDGGQEVPVAASLQQQHRHVRVLGQPGA